MSLASDGAVAVGEGKEVDVPMTTLFGPTPPPLPHEPDDIPIPNLRDYATVAAATVSIGRVDGWEGYSTWPYAVSLIGTDEPELPY